MGLGGRGGDRNPNPNYHVYYELCVFFVVLVGIISMVDYGGIFGLKPHISRAIERL